jgi:hypothetical protein
VLTCFSSHEEPETRHLSWAAFLPHPGQEGWSGLVEPRSYMVLVVTKRSPLDV